ncbi:MAG: DUF4874 domain-containing protein [Lachnospiraceae bacterium]|nr:DUF4874 domain-containing protein [Butyrivibrio sp.]MCM1344163.1 DUF4874 domain-containing protein [Muribaculaceae bacterium]MCM1411354.1 DUF4874 domain-containing protein [Lachnospiraceae bacterium]
MIFFSNKGMPAFRQEKFRETPGNVLNPGRGWYRIYTYALTEDGQYELPPALYDGETLALVLIDISAYQERPISDQGLSDMDRILGCFAESGREMILRVVYDTAGRGMEHEPALFSQVQRHMEQMAPLLVRYSDYIFVYQGLLVGSWGEMHTSKFVSEKYLRQLAENFFFLTENGLKLAVRRPVQYRLIQGVECERLPLTGCFDDAIFASETHMGTFGIQERQEAGWDGPWCPEEEIRFLEKLAEKVPFGGEVLSGEDGMAAADAVRRLSGLHVSYLNCVHEEARLKEWRETEYAPGISLYDYIGAHLGYRFVVEKAVCERKKKEAHLAVKVANRGFACCTEELQFILCLRRGGEERQIPVDCGLGKLEGGKSMTLQIPLEEEMQRSGTCLYGRLQRVRDRRVIAFANEGAGESLLLGSFD